MWPTSLFTDGSTPRVKRLAAAIRENHHTKEKNAMSNPSAQPDPHFRAKVLRRTLVAIAIFLIFFFGILIYQLTLR